MTKHTTVTVAPDPDQDDCLAAAAADFIAEHPELAGWDLEPRWQDDERDAIVLTIPAWAATYWSEALKRRVTIPED